MENSKQGYSEITRLRVPNTLHDTNVLETADNLNFFNITYRTLILHEMHINLSKTEYTKSGYQFHNIHLIQIILTK